MTERVWDRFLTEQDRALASFKPPRRVGFGKHPALLLVDIYRWVFGDKPQPVLESVKTWPGSCGLAGWNALPHIQKLLSAAREAEIPIAYVTGLYPEESGVDGWSGRGTGRGGNKNPRSDGSRQDKYEIVEELKPLPGEAFLRKSAPSAFWGTPLIAHLHSLGVDTIVTCGESTSGCVRASVVDGRTYGFRMIVVEECVFDRTEAAHAINLFDMNQKYADVVSLDEAIQYLRKWKMENKA
ncbi:MAG: isochorismatase family protein [Thaumarchaeota archaeon]|nr:isochorismatase family protein [Nitrososphaerota archaeon]